MFFPWRRASLKELPFFVKAIPWRIFVDPLQLSYSKLRIKVEPDAAET
jgi:hypothetical protein